MKRPASDEARTGFAAGVKRTLIMFMPIIPIVAGVLLLTGLMVEFLPMDKVADWFGRNDLLDALIGSSVGSIAAGHPLTSYVLGGELLDKGVSLVAVTALIVSWVTVGSIQLPAEALMLGRRFALYRNLIAFILAIVIGMLTVATLRVVDQSGDGEVPRSSSSPPSGIPAVGDVRSSLGQALVQGAAQLPGSSDERGIR